MKKPVFTRKRPVLTTEKEMKNEKDYYFRWHTYGCGGGYESNTWNEHQDFQNFEDALNAMTDGGKMAPFCGDWIESIKINNEEE